MILGAHVSAAGGVRKAPANGAALGIQAIQVFTKNQRQWKAKPLMDEEVAAWHKAYRKAELTYACSHVSYLINLCAPDEEKRRKSIDAMIDELERGERLGLSDAVVHPGSHLKRGENWGLNTIAASLNDVHERTRGFRIRTCLEVTAGQGTNLGYRFEHLARILEGVSEPERVSVCYDTCHGHSAGIDLTSEESYEAAWQRFDELLGLARLAVFHLNDTKKELGSRVDRHEQIGEGLLPETVFRRLLNDRGRFAGVPAILETPAGEEGYVRDLARLRAWAEAPE